MRGKEGTMLPGGHGSVPTEERLPFVVTAAHELKAPLSLVRQLALGLETGLISNEAEKERLIRQIVLVSERGLRLTTDLSKASRLEDSLFELEPVNPQQICEEVATELAPLYEARGRQIKFAPRRRSMLAIANRDLLRRVILNFGDNALHYAEGEPVEIFASIRKKGTIIRIGVRDYGPALPKNVWERLSAHVGKTSQPLHARPQSSGLGLVVASQFAEAMNGQIGASRHQNGVTFYVDIDASLQLSLL